MGKGTYAEVMWLFHQLGRHLRQIAPDAPEGCDSRKLLNYIIQESKDHPRRFVGGRNPFNWLKELQAAANFWHHLQPESDVPEEDIWRDLDTLERVAVYLRLDPEFVEDVRGVKERIRAEHTSEDKQPSEDEIRSWIREEAAQQIAIALREPQAAPHDEVRVPAGAAEVVRREPLPLRQAVPQPPKERGELADRVRSFVIDNYIAPAREQGQKEVRVRAGVVDKALGYRYRRLPLICAALRSQKFLEAARVRLLVEEGPPSGASTSTTFLYELE